MILIYTHATLLEGQYERRRSEKYSKLTDLWLFLWQNIDHVSKWTLCTALDPICCFNKNCDTKILILPLFPTDIRPAWNKKKRKIFKIDRSIAVLETDTVIIFSKLTKYSASTTAILQVQLIHPHYLYIKVNMNEEGADKDEKWPISYQSGFYTDMAWCAAFGTKKGLLVRENTNDEIVRFLLDVWCPYVSMSLCVH